MQKKKLTLSISSSKKTIKSIEDAKSQSKNSVIIDKKPGRFIGKSNFKRTTTRNQNLTEKSSHFSKQKQHTKPNFFSKPGVAVPSDFEKRKDQNFWLGHYKHMISLDDKIEEFNKL